MKINVNVLIKNLSSLLFKILMVLIIASFLEILYKQTSVDHTYSSWNLIINFLNFISK